MTRQDRKRIVAFDVRPRKFGFVVFEGANELLDFGTKGFPKGSRGRVPPRQKLADIFTDFDPKAVVLNDRVLHWSERKSRIKDALEKEASKRRVPIRFVSTGVVRKAFVGRDRNKQEIASALADQFYALAARLPPRRRPWQSEHHRTSIFDAAALGVAYFARGNKEKEKFSSDDSNVIIADRIKRYKPRP